MRHTRLGIQKLEKMTKVSHLILLHFDQIKLNNYFLQLQAHIKADHLAVGLRKPRVVPDDGAVEILSEDEYQ